MKMDVSRLHEKRYLSTVHVYSTLIPYITTLLLSSHSLSVHLVVSLSIRVLALLHLTVAHLPHASTALYVRLVRLAPNAIIFHAIWIVCRVVIEREYFALDVSAHGPWNRHWKSKTKRPQPQQQQQQRKKRGKNETKMTNIAFHSMNFAYAWTATISQCARALARLLATWRTSLGYAGGGGTIARRIFWTNNFINLKFYTHATDYYY